jgi:Na+-driven multidrug efflux pump
MVVGAIVNTILDPLFIFVFNMGVSGAAIATTISQVVSFALAFSYLFKFKQVKITKSVLKIDLKLWGQVALLGMSNSFNQLAIAAVQITLNNLIRHYGALSIYGADIPLAACGVIMKVNSIFISVFVGFSQGAQPIFGYNYGAKQYDRVTKTYVTVVKICAIVAITGTLLFQIIPRPIISIFGSGDELYYEFSVKFMRIFLSMLICVGIQIFSSNLFSAIGKPAIGVILSLSRQLFLFIPLCVLLPTFMGLDGILFAGPIADVISFIIAMFFVTRELKSYKKLQTLEETN